MALIDRFIQKRQPLAPGGQPQKTGGLLIDRFVTARPTPTPTPTPKPAAGQRAKKFATGVGKFAARTGVEFANLASSTLDFASDFFQSAVDRKIRTPIPLSKFETEKSRERADKWKSFFGKTLAPATEKFKGFTQSLREVEFIKPEEDWVKASTKEKITTRLPETILNIGPGLLSSLGSFAVNPALGFALASGSVADEVKTIGVENGLDEEKAEMLGLGTGVIVGFIDKIVPDELFTPQGKKKFVGGLAKRMVKTGLKEAGTEIAQEDIQLLVESTLRDDISSKEIVERNVLAGLGGLLGGAGARGSVEFVNNIRAGEIGDVDVTKVTPTEEGVEATRITPGRREKITVTQNYDGAEAAFAIIRPDGTAAIDVRLEEGAQGKGLGTRIVDDLESRVQRRGVRTVELTAFDESVGFWEKQGYERTGETDAQGNIKLTKTLTAAPVARPDVVEGDTLASKVEQFENVDKFVKATHEISTESLEPSIVKENFKPESKVAKGPVVARVESDGTITVVSGLQKYFDAVDAGKAVVAVQFDQDHVPTLTGLREVFSRARTEVQKEADRKREAEERKPAKKKKPEKKKKPVKKKAPAEKVTEDKIKNVKDQKDVRRTLKNIRRELSEAVTEAEGLAVVAVEQREGIDTDDVAKLKRIVALNKKFREGDIETIRASKSKDLVNRVVQNVQEVNPGMSEQEAFEFALALPTKAQEKARTSQIVELERNEKKLSKLMKQLRQKQKDLNIKQDKALTDEWERVVALQEELENIIQVPERQLPVGEGKKKVSRLEARIKDKLDVVNEEEIEELGLSTFRQMNKKENIRRASEYVTQNPDEALRVVKGEIDPPRGILVNSVFIALNRLADTDTDVATKVASLGATRMGQEISILSEIDKDSAAVMMQDVVRTRVEAFEKRTKKRISDKIKSERKKVDESVKAPNTRQWDAFLKEILC